MHRDSQVSTVIQSNYWPASPVPRGKRRSSRQRAKERTFFKGSNIGRRAREPSSTRS